MLARSWSTEIVSRLLLVRHGQSTWNAQGRWQGQADPPLSEAGVAQASAAAKLLDHGIDVIWSSDLQRAHHTARILAAPRALTVVPDPRVRERDAGPWTGLTRDEIEAQFPGYLTARRRPPGFEADDALARRALDALREFAAALDGGTGLVVTHGGLILAVERHHGLERTPIANLEGRWLEWTGSEFVVGSRAALA